MIFILLIVSCVDYSGLERCELKEKGKFKTKESCQVEANKYQASMCVKVDLKEAKNGK